MEYKHNIYVFKVRWRTILIGLLIQFTMGMISIRWDMGRQLFKCLGHLAETFLEYSYVGATMVFGERIVREDHVFAFQVSQLYKVKQNTVKTVSLNKDNIYYTTGMAENYLCSLYIVLKQ